MMSRKAKELELLLTQRMHENELMRKRIATLEADNERLLSQEQSVLLAITEANRAAARIRAEAEAEAAAITDKAEKEKASMLDDAQQNVTAAATRANSILSLAETEATRMRDNANEYASQKRLLADCDYATRQREADSYYDTKKNEADSYYDIKCKEADAYSENIRMNANIHAERTIFAAQKEVNERKTVLGSLNDLLNQVASYSAAQAAAFSEMLVSLADSAVAEQERICADIDKCSCNCSECNANCVNSEVCTEETAMQPTVCESIEETPVCKGEPCDEAPACEGEPCDEAPACEGEPCDETPACEGEPCDEAPACEGEPCDEASACEGEPDAAVCDDGGDGDLPKDYETPAELMRSIYTIEGRELPIGAPDDMSDTSPFGGISFADELDEGAEVSGVADIPSDQGLDKLLEDVL